MKIEVGKAYWTRDGRKAVVTGRMGGFWPWFGSIEGARSSWGEDGWQHRQPSNADLIASWEEGKQDSKMDVNVGDRVLIEVRVTQVSASGAIAFAPIDPGMGWTVSAIKSVQPAPPGVGDTLQWNGCGFNRDVFGIHGDKVWIASGEAGGQIDVLSEIAVRPGFRIVKRASK